MNYEHVCESLHKKMDVPDPKFDYLFDMPLGKINTNVKLNQGDNSVILCKEPYAQELYDYFYKSMNHTTPKDLTKNVVYDVYPVSYNNMDKLVKCVEKNSGAEVFVPFSEIKNMGDLSSDVSFKVLVTNTKNNFNQGSRKKCERIIDFNTLGEYLKTNEDFEVTITQLVNGGFIAVYNKTTQCFLPGAQAAPNIIYDFNSYLGKTIRVCVDNYDPLSELYILSHKRYIKKIMPERVQDIRFGQKYKGVLTSNPTKYGIFIEFAVDPAYGSMFTGLIKASDIPAGAKYKQGDEVEFYVSDVSLRGNLAKINLTFNEADVNKDNLEWQKYKDNMENKTFGYRFDDGRLIITDGDSDLLSLNLDYDSIKDEIVGKQSVRLSKVDIINKQVGLDFIK